MRVVALTLLAILAQAQQIPQERQLNLDSFEKVWITIRDKHWQKDPAGLDWQKIHDEYRPQAEKAKTIDETRVVIRAMLGRLKETHFAILPSRVYTNVEESSAGSGSTGIELRILDGEAIVVSVDPHSSAEELGVKAGWKIQNAKGENIADAIKSVSNLTELMATRAIANNLSGPIGSSIKATFLDGAGKSQERALDLREPRGRLTTFGNLPPTYVWVDSRHIQNTGYIRFNEFLDLVRVMNTFSDLIKSCEHCDGLIIDLRGNPGGIGGMAMGMAGFLIDKPNQRLGTTYLRDATLNFVINPRPNQFSGPVAILVDSSSASTSEIFAGGLKDLGRARIFGTRTAAAALPSVIERLPNGDGFQYAIANYISEGGKALEGLGVEPDETVKLTRESLLAGHDAVLDAALNWIQKKGNQKQ
jgi:carboxyl-terminal processing protease